MCPRDANALLTEEAQALFDVFPFVWRQSRVSQAGFIGLDIPACLEVIEAYGIDRRFAALLLPYAEAGWLLASRAADD